MLHRNATECINLTIPDLINSTFTVSGLKVQQIEVLWFHFFILAICGNGIQTYNHLNCKKSTQNCISAERQLHQLFIAFYFVKHSLYFSSNRIITGTYILSQILFEKLSISYNFGGILKEILYLKKMPQGYRATTRREYSFSH